MSEFRVRYPFGGQCFSLFTQHGREWSMAPLLADSFSAELQAARRKAENAMELDTIGVVEGNRRVLHVDLPCHSVHEARFVREPMRLNVVIEAPIEAMNAILEKRPSVRALVDNGWLHLYALGAAGHVIHRYAGGLTWEPVAPMNAELAA